MLLTESEMVRMYRNALKPRQQIRILAELNQIPVEMVVEILERNGVNTTRRKGRRKTRNGGQRWEPDKRVAENPKGFYGAFRRLLEGASQSAVSRALGISQGTISRFANEKGLPAHSSYEKILKYAGKESEEFLNETEIHDPPE